MKFLYIRQWAIWTLGMYAGGASFPKMPSIEDEKHYFENNVGLNVKDADGNMADGIEEALIRVGMPGRFWHDVKNVPHEWFKKYPKLAFKFSAFWILILTISLWISLGFNVWQAI